MKKATSSPKKERKLMTFAQALDQVLAGKKISRTIFPQGEYGYLKEGKLHIQKDQEFMWIVSDGDITATDWFVLE